MTAAAKKLRTAYRPMGETRRMRAAVVERAGGCCESCGIHCGVDGHWDHFFGRGKVAQSVESTWLLCARCDDHKTRNHPNAASWLRRFVVHADCYRYVAESALAMTKLATLKAKGRA